MTFTPTETGYDVFYNFARRKLSVGCIHHTETILYSYTDRLFHASAIILHSHSLSYLKDTISDYYSLRDTIAAIEEKWL